MGRERDQQLLNLPAMKCSNGRPGRGTRNPPCWQIFPHVFWKGWLASWLLATPSTYLSVYGQTNKNCTHTGHMPCVSRKAHMWSSLTFQTAHLVTWLMQGREHPFFQTAAAHRKAAVFGLQGDSQTSYLGDASSLSSGVMARACSIAAACVLCRYSEETWLLMAFLQVYFQFQKLGIFIVYSSFRSAMWDCQFER